MKFYNVNGNRVCGVSPADAHRRAVAQGYIPADLPCLAKLIDDDATELRLTPAAEKALSTPRPKAKGKPKAKAPTKAGRSTRTPTGAR